MGGCLCHGYITHVLWLWNDVPFPPFTAVFLLIKEVHIASGALCSIIFYVLVSG